MNNPNNVQENENKDGKVTINQTPQDRKAEEQKKILEEYTKRLPKVGVNSRGEVNMDKVSTMLSEGMGERISGIQRAVELGLVKQLVSSECAFENKNYPSICEKCDTPNKNYVPITWTMLKQMERVVSLKI